MAWAPAGAGRIGAPGPRRQRRARNRQKPVQLRFRAGRSGGRVEIGAASAPLDGFFSRRQATLKRAQLRPAMRPRPQAAGFGPAPGPGRRDPMELKEIRAAERLLGHRFKDRELLEQALTHASVADSRLESNE